VDGTRQTGLDGWDQLSASLGVEASALVRLRQVHCAGVFVANGVETSFAEWPEADIAVSDSPLVALSVRAADCVPILLADRRSRAVAAIHAGWQGTAAGAAIVAVEALTSRFGTMPADVVAAIGPSIGPCCYEVGPELARRFSSHPDAPAWFSPHPRPRLDLWRATRDQLVRADVPQAQIHVCGLCTFDYPRLFHSYRRDGKNAGRLVAAIRSARDKTP
jgi:YfiH family protein